MTKIVIPPSLLTPQPETSKPEATRVESAARAAIIAGGFLALGLGALILLAVYYWPGVRVHLVGLFLLAMAAGLIFAAAAGVSWTRTAATRAWWIEDAERNRRWWYEDHQAEEAPAVAASEVSAPERIRLAGYQILVLHYLQGMDATRPECEDFGISQNDWNAVNAAFLALKIKSARKWVLDDYREALGRWTDQIEIRPDGSAMVKRAGGWERVELK